MSKTAQTEAVKRWIPKDGTTWTGLHWVVDIYEMSDYSVPTCNELSLIVRDDAEEYPLSQSTLSPETIESVIGSFHGDLRVTTLQFDFNIEQRTDVLDDTAKFSCYILSPKVDPKELEIPMVPFFLQMPETEQPPMEQPLMDEPIAVEYIEGEEEEEAELEELLHLHAEGGVGDDELQQQQQQQQQLQLQLQHQQQLQEEENMAPEEMEQQLQEEVNYWEQVQREFEATDLTGGLDGKKTQLAIVVLRSKTTPNQWFEGRLHGPDGPLVVFGREKDEGECVLLESMYLFKE
eukprot:TRINITY_DN1249_c0_g1_i1.p2 TRINITY_DN1249_c0_g1~~TRINITY_DN1249_c0_g1_i1.p2  ORF type:complete len:291 (-),score=86.52 TRINITY_DN1249_c0_g1_i1:547-1419(-)